MRKQLTWILAGIFGAFHLAFVMGPYIVAGGTGEAVGWRMIVLDYPLSWVLQVTGLFEHMESKAGGLVYGVFGTAMYAAAGALIGYGIDKLRARNGAGT